ncbi:response regulator transcription factor [Paenibacillus hemerocallicola]|uniref:Response regulator transcription factor n=1 Tax=Paenibacillus hemerocallicola TaxID=1172614 RepID=A0A5C4T6R5_9BACL|nr:response regulator transcription factor [Paenibacillus hemerocallicola]TNJ64783.1 response regulator transcription factor [Paenibacillus hemerocallicola]
MSPMFRVMLVDDHKHAREGMRTILRMDPAFEIVAEATSGQEAIAFTDVCMPDMILMDIQMPTMDGLDATKAIKEKYPYIKIVMVTVSDDIAHLFEALKKGAQGYLLKNLHPEEWHHYLKAIALDEAPLSRGLAMRILQEFSHKQQPKSEPSPLTGREKEILRLVAQGLPNREIAQQLDISEHTVKNHLKNILHKLHLENRVQLARYAFDRGITGIT